MENMLYLRTGAAGFPGSRAAADQGRRGECCSLANEEVTLKELCGMLNQELHCGTCKAYLPLGLAKSMARALERKAKHAGKQPLMTTFSVYHPERNNSFDCSRARREPGDRTRPYAQTLHDEAAWLRAEGKV